ncbi:MAG: hypothetical protein OXI67_02705 [Candidatus Poribacteria bacterium]|nr:hypothetical protein [Candidatus Poribacteria bacterium]
MDLQQINIKVFVTEESTVNHTNFIKVFNRWMEEADSEDYLNYADYSHVDAGPGVLLILKQANYSIDSAFHEPGFLYNRKHNVEGDNAEKIRQALAETLSKCELLEASEELENAIHFNGSDILFMINNRHIAPNTAETADAIQADLEPVLKQMYGGDDFTIERTSEDARERFAVRISANSEKPISELVSNLGG